MKTATIIDSETIRIKIPYNDLISAKLISGMKGVYYDRLLDIYEVPLDLQNVDALSGKGFTFSRNLARWHEKRHLEKEERKRGIKRIPGLSKKLRPYQIQGIELIEHFNGRALLADDMGLGKTAQALVWTKIHPEEKPVLIVCPGGLKINWEREIQMWVDENANVQICTGQTPENITGEFVIINYEILPYWVKEISKINFKILLADEVHYTKNARAKRTKAFKRIARKMKYVIGISGTPIESRPVEIYNIATILQPSVFPDYLRFTQRYCQGEIDRYGWNVSGSNNTLELNKILKDSMMIRRLKSQVAQDLPPKTIAHLPLELTNTKEYKQAEYEFIQFINDRFDKDLLYEENFEKDLKIYAKRHKLKLDNSEELTRQDISKIKKTKIEKASSAEVLLKTHSLQMLVAEGKMKEAIHWIQDFLDSGEKLVVFAVNKKIIKMLMDKFNRIAVKVDGSVTSHQKQEAVDMFQTNKNVRLFIGNIKAAGVGITLTAASNIAILQFPWVPGWISQAIDRVHRITQVNKVTIWYLTGADTIEEKVLGILAEKEKMINEVLDGKQHKEKSMITELLKMYKEEKR
jgi:SWI/SNF-related matrix-associated actin-dependent regulator of chromatin subfamily A-like protein 1